MKEDLELELFQEEIDGLEQMLSDGYQFSHFDHVLDIEGEETIGKQLPVRRFRGPIVRYLLQLRIGWEEPEHDDPQQHALAVLSRSITTLGGHIDQHWSTPGEYDLILVVSLYSQEVSIDAHEMALRSMPLVKSVRITPLLPLDKPSDTPVKNWDGWATGLPAKRVSADVEDLIIGLDQAPDKIDAYEFDDE